MEIPSMKVWLNISSQCSVPCRSVQEKWNRGHLLYLHMEYLCSKSIEQNCYSTYLKLVTTKLQTQWHLTWWSCPLHSHRADKKTYIYKIYFVLQGDTRNLTMRLIYFFASQAIYSTSKWHCKWFAVQLQAGDGSRCCKLCMVCWVH